MNDLDSNQLPFFENIPMDNPDGKKKKKKKYGNCIGDVLREILEERKLSIAKIHKDTEIPFPTIDDWSKSKSVPLTDENLYILKKYLGVSIEYLCYGTGIRSSLEKAVERLAKQFSVDEEVIEAIMEGEYYEE